MPAKYADILNKIVPEITPYTLGLLLILFLTFRYRKAVSTEFRRLFPLFIYWALSEFVGIYTRIEYKSNTLVHHVYVVLYYLLVVYYFYPILKSEKGMKIYFFASSILLILFSVFNALFFQPLTVIPANAIMFHCLFILTITLFSFKQMLANPIPLLLRFQSRFWISASMLVFNSWIFFFFSTHVYFLQLETYPRLFLRIPVVISFIMLLLFLVAFWAEIKTKQFRHEDIAK